MNRGGTENTCLRSLSEPTSKIWYWFRCFIQSLHYLKMFHSFCFHNRKNSTFIIHTLKIKAKQAKLCLYLNTKPLRHINVLTPCKRIFPFCGIRRFLTADLILIQLNPDYALTTHFRSHFNIILTSMPGSSKWSLPIRISI
jgi:hypothetical protein